MAELIKVGMADLKVTLSPNILTTLGLGSCVGIVLYDSLLKIAGLAHIMLPSSGEIRDNSNPAKFADSGIDKLISEMKALGAAQSRLVAKIAGGAQMFAFEQTSEIMRIGFRNVIATKEVLNKYKIPVLAEDTGGNFGRTIEFYTDSGILLVKTLGKGIKEL